MRKVVVWSGGADSTLVLLQLLKQEGGDVHAISVEHEQIDRTQLFKQAGARSLFMRWASKKFKRFSTEVVMVHRTSYTSEGSGQSLIWLSAVAPVLQHGDIVSMGYVRGDDFWHYKEKFVIAFNAASRLRDEGIYDQNIKALGIPTLNFPLEWYTKEEVVRELFQAGVPAHAWVTCDCSHTNAFNTPMTWNCGQCNHCKEMQAIKDPELRKYMELDESGWPGDQAVLAKAVPADDVVSDGKLAAAAYKLADDCEVFVQSLEPKENPFLLRYSVPAEDDDVAPMEEAHHGTKKHH